MAKSDKLWARLQEWEFDALTSEFQDYLIALRREKHNLFNLLLEWFVDGRFLVANCPENADLVRRTKEALARERDDE